MKTHF